MHKRLVSLYKHLTRPHEYITVVSGLPRSGTSLMMQMLQAGGLELLSDDLRQPDVDNPKGYYEFERVKKLKDGDLAWVSSARSKVVKVVSPLLEYLPAAYSYRILFMQRRMAEILASQRKMLARRGQVDDPVSDEQMATAFENHLRKVTAWLAQQPNMKVLYVSYNGLLEAPLAHLEEINHFLDNRLQVEEMLKVIDQDLYRQRAL